MGKWKAFRKSKEQDVLLKSIVAMMIKRSEFAVEFDIPVGMIVMTQRGTNRGAAVVTYLMDSPEVVEKMMVVRTYKMTKDEAMKILNIGSGAAITWLKPRAMDLIARSVLDGSISMPELLSLVAYETVTPPADLHEGRLSQEFNATFGSIAMRGGFVSHNSIDE